MVLMGSRSYCNSLCMDGMLPYISPACSDTESESDPDLESMQGFLKYRVKETEFYR